MIRRIAGTLMRPRATFAELVTRPAWIGTWLGLLITWALCGGWVLATDIGQQALVDERVRVIEAFGGIVTDEQYAALLARPPWWVYFTSGGRALLTPAVTLVAALAVWAVARLEGVSSRLTHGLSVAVHASLVLLIGQLIATPLSYVRESLTSPLNMAAILPFMEEGTFRARLFGSLDVFALWWAWLLALGTSALTGRRVGRYFGPLVLVFVVAAGGVAAAIAMLGGA